MNVTVSSKYQIVIPKEIREALRIKPGQKLAFVNWGDHVSLVPVRPIQELRGLLKGAPPFEREPDREF